MRVLDDFCVGFVWHKYFLCMTFPAPYRLLHHAYMLAIFDQCRSARDHVLSARQTTPYLNHVSVRVPQFNGAASNDGGILSLRQQNGETLRILWVANDCAERNGKHGI